MADHSFLLKHTGSGAHDSYIDYRIEDDLKTVTITRMRLKAGQEAISTPHLEHFIFEWLPSKHDIVAYTDETKGGWTGKPGN
jgi:hypothetical protein